MKVFPFNILVITGLIDIAIYISDVDECFYEEGICGEGGFCANSPGGYDCFCQNGYLLTEYGTCEGMCNVILNITPLCAS